MDRIQHEPKIIEKNQQKSTKCIGFWRVKKKSFWHIGKMNTIKFFYVYICNIHLSNIIINKYKFVATINIRIVANFEREERLGWGDGGKFWDVWQRSIS